MLGLSHVVEPNLLLGSELSCQHSACGLSSPCHRDAGRVWTTEFPFLKGSVLPFTCGVSLSSDFLLLSSVHFSWRSRLLHIHDCVLCSTELLPGACRGREADGTPWEACSCLPHSNVQGQSFHTMSSLAKCDAHLFLLTYLSGSWFLESQSTGSLFNFSVSLLLKWDDRSTFVFKMGKAHRVVKVLVAQSCLTFCYPMDCSPPGSSVHGILQAKILECIAIHFSRGSFQSKDSIWVSHIADRFFTI